MKLYIIELIDSDTEGYTTIKEQAFLSVDEAKDHLKQYEFILKGDVIFEKTKNWNDEGFAIEKENIVIKTTKNEYPLTHVGTILEINLKEK